MYKLMLKSVMQDNDILEDNRQKVCKEEEPKELVNIGLASCLEFTSTTLKSTTITTTTVKPNTIYQEEEGGGQTCSNQYLKQGTHDHSEDEEVMKAVMPLN